MGGRLAKPGPAVKVATALVRLNAITTRRSQAEFAEKPHRRQTRQREVLYIDVDLFDHRVRPVGLVSGDGAETVGSEEGVVLFAATSPLTRQVRCRTVP